MGLYALSSSDKLVVEDQLSHDQCAEGHLRQQLYMRTLFKVIQTSCFMYLIFCCSVVETNIMVSGMWNNFAELFCSVFLCCEYCLMNAQQTGYFGITPCDGVIPKL